MNSSVTLNLLKCPQCSTPVPAEEDEVAWVCATCGAGLQLSQTGLAPVAVHWAAAPAAAPAGQRVDGWRPFWVFTGSAHFSSRLSFVGQTAPEPLWNNTVRFFVPAYVCPLAQLQSLGADLTRRQPALQAGPAGTLAGCTFLPEDAERAAEFVVLTIEAARPDKLRLVQFNLQLAAPELWVLPFSGEQLLV
jgi:hypothetical protein